MKLNLSYFLIFFVSALQSQNIKSIQLRPLQEKVFTAIVPLGTVLELSFDDLDADSKDYQYKITHKTHDWQDSNMLTSQYIDGFDQNAILEVTNSFNTLQSYTHYSVQIPNANSVITKSGNYVISVLDDDDEEVFSRRFVLFENQTIVGVTAERSRNTKTVNTQQTVEFSINYPNFTINNPNQEINVVVLKNENWTDKISNIQPTFFKNNQLVYSYTNETNFWGDNEYLNFDTKFLRNRSLGIHHIAQKEVFHHFLYPNQYHPDKTYKYNPDINGQFLIRTLEANDSNTEADYAMMHFTLAVPHPFQGEALYVYGAFNNFEITDENKMYYDEKSNTYQASILLKQGFYNYTFASVGSDDTVNLRRINGSHFQTENEYTVLVYYKAFGDIYDRVIGVGRGFFNQNQ